jgi:hypothetical protein
VEVVPITKEEAAILETLRSKGNWARVRVTRIRPFNNRLVGDLLPHELRAIRDNWMAKVEAAWGSVDSEVRLHYFAVKLALQAGEQEQPRSPESVPLPPHEVRKENLDPLLAAPINPSPASMSTGVPQQVSVEHDPALAEDTIWRSFVIRIEGWDGKQLGNLNRAEFDELRNSELLARIASNPEDFGEYLQALAVAVTQRAKSEAQESESRSEGQEQVSPPGPGANIKREFTPLLPLSQTSRGSEHQRMAPALIRKRGAEIAESQPHSQPPGEGEAGVIVFRLQTRSEAIWELKRLGKEVAEQRILEILEVADVAISQAQTLATARQLCGVAEIVRTCTSELDMAQEIQNDAASFAIHAEFHAGQLLKAARDRGELSTGTRGQLHGRTATGDPNMSKSSAASGAPLVLRQKKCPLMELVSTRILPSEFGDGKI